ncbi:MAG: flagellin, partial [Nitrospinaceae bacterium]
QVASGRRLVKGGIDAAGLALSEQLRSDIAALGQAVNNIESGANFVRVAEGGLATISDLLARGRELSIQAANGALGDAERQTLNQVLSQLLTEIDRITATQEFNGQPILNGNLAPGANNPVEIQAGIRSGPENRISLNVIEATDTQTLGLATANVLTPQAALQASDILGQAQQQVTARRGQVGAVSNRLDIAARNARNTLVNLEASRGEIADTDLPRALSDLGGKLLAVEASVRTLALQIRQNESAVGRILNINT